MTSPRATRMLARCRSAGPRGCRSRRGSCSLTSSRWRCWRAGSSTSIRTVAGSSTNACGSRSAKRGSSPSRSSRSPSSNAPNWRSGLRARRACGCGSTTDATCRSSIPASSGFAISCCRTRTSRTGARPPRVSSTRSSTPSSAHRAHRCIANISRGSTGRTCGPSAQPRPSPQRCGVPPTVPR